MKSNSERIKHQMLQNAKELARLNARIHETVIHRDKSDRAREEWTAACAEFHHRYDELSFPGGYSTAAQRILAGEPHAMEAAVCFLECRPYFFRSGYMFKELLRRTKRAPLTQEQLERLAGVVQRQAEWQAIWRGENAA